MCMCLQVFVRSGWGVWDLHGPAGPAFSKGMGIGVFAHLASVCACVRGCEP